MFHSPLASCLAIWSLFLCNLEYRLGSWSTFTTVVDTELGIALGLLFDVINPHVQHPLSL